MAGSETDAESRDGWNVLHDLWSSHRGEPIIKLPVSGWIRTFLEPVRFRLNQTGSFPEKLQKISEIELINIVLGENGWTAQQDLTAVDDLQFTQAACLERFVAGL